MAPLRFNIPLQRKDLLRGASDGQYWVENEYSIRELKTKLVVSLFSKIDIKIHAINQLTVVRLIEIYQCLNFTTVSLMEQNYHK